LGIDQRILAVVVVRWTIDVVVAIIISVIIISLQRTPATHCAASSTATLVSRDTDEIGQIGESVLLLKSPVLGNLLQSGIPRLQIRFQSIITRLVYYIELNIPLNPNPNSPFNDFGFVLQRLFVSSQLFFLFIVSLL
jgi:hypothetical protein